MKRIIVSIVAILAAAALAGGATVAEAGKRLFADPRLGTTGKSCADCHPDGSGASVKGKTDAEAVKTVNGCIAGPLEGKPLAPDSAEMRGLVEYLKGL
jgi:cytochrome c peroxidase